MRAGSENERNGSSSVERPQQVLAKRSGIDPTGHDRSLKLLSIAEQYGRHLARDLANKKRSGYGVVGLVLAAALLVVVILILFRWIE